MIKSFAAGIGAALVLAGGLFAPSTAEAFLHNSHRDWHRGHAQHLHCPYVAPHALKHRHCYSKAFRKGTAGYSFSSRANTPFYVGVTNQYRYAGSRSRRGY
jgi:hypothetical protein